MLQRYLNSPPTRPTLFKRIWFSGMVQVMAGMVLTVTVFYLASLLWKHFA